jgi:hypothetical protein
MVGILFFLNFKAYPEISKFEISRHTRHRSGVENTLLHSQLRIHPTERSGDSCSIASQQNTKHQTLLLLTFSSFPQRTN